jgi:serine/threonine protein kinase/Tol biopolymer transport system component
MTLKPGTVFGPYEILSQIDKGGMAEVYRARDSRLGRDAAIKVILAAYAGDPEMVRRFGHEARSASALNHPNIVTVYDVGTADQVPWIAMELVEGRSLRDVLRSGRLPFLRALDIGAQIAEGLAVAHSRGLVHRDLKPKNVMVTRDDHVKILDFGLAKRFEVAPSGGEEPTGPPLEETSLTKTGAMVGTLGYMSPEQMRGEAADFHSDQFSLGLVLYEMASGRRAFEGSSPADMLSAVLRDEATPLQELEPTLPAPFCWIVERCLAKDPEKRYASSRDLASDLKGLRQHISSVTKVSPMPLPAPRPATGRRLLYAGAIVAAAALGALATLPRRGPSPPPRFEQLSFQRGTLWSARYGPDGKTVFYSAAWDGKPFRIFRRASPGGVAQPLDLPDGNLLAVSRSGELALCLDCRVVPPGGITIGTLARAPLEGGAPREVASGVLFADWSPDGKELAVVRADPGTGKVVLEFPIGKRLYETGGGVTWPRVSPRGDLVAFLDHPARGDNRGTVAVVDRSGRKRTLSRAWAAAAGLVWRPDGEEVWIGANAEREDHAIHAVTLSGETRVVGRGPGNLTILDFSADGRALITRDGEPMGVKLVADGAEREVSWLDSSLLTDLSADGRQVLLTAFGRSVGASYGGFLRRMDAAGPIDLGEGFAQALSPDATQVLSILSVTPPQLRVLPAGVGTPRQVVPQGLSALVWASWFPDGKRIVAAGTEPGHGVRLYACDLESGRTRALSPEGIGVEHYQGIPVSPDGQRLAAIGPDGKLAVYPASGGDWRGIPDLPSGTVPIAWTADGRELYVFRIDEFPARIFLVDPGSGEKRLWQTIALSDPAGVHGFPSIRVTPDGKAFAYSYKRFLSELYEAEGLK